MKRKTAQQMNLPVLGVIRAYKVVGVKPDEMGIGPAFAIPEALDQAGMYKTYIPCIYYKVIRDL